MCKRIVLILAALLHFGFVYGEMFPTSNGFAWPGEPPLMTSLTGKKNAKLAEPDRIDFSRTERPFVATVVRNAGIYNLIVACGLVWAAFPGISGSELNPRAARAVGLYFSCGAIVAGLFGLTLSDLTWIQLGVGALGLVACYLSPVDVKRS